MIRRLAFLALVPLMALPARADKEFLKSGRVTPLEIRRKKEQAGREAASEGFSPLPRQPRIVGGNDAAAAEYPWMAALVQADEPDNYAAFFCGGSLIHPRWVLTASHCVSGLKAGELEVALGTANLNSPLHVQRIAVAEIVTSPDYNPFNLDSDFALLRLAEPASANLAPIPLIDEAALANPGIQAVITGWGDTTNGDGEYPGRLQEAQIPIVDLAIANASPSYQGTLTENMLAAGLANGGKDSCFGDSGGPLIVPSPLGGSMQAGVVSFGAGCAVAGVYGIYSRVSNFRRLILGHTLPNYAAWEIANDRSGERRDPDGNGFTNFEDFALPDHVLNQQVADGFVRFSYVRPVFADEVKYTLENAPSGAGPWTPKSPAFVSVEELGGGMLRWTVELPVAQNTGAFRVRAQVSDQAVAGPRPFDFPGGTTGTLDPPVPLPPFTSPRAYRLNALPIGEAVSVTLRSSDFNAYLELLDGATLEVLQSSSANQAGGVHGEDEILTFTPEAGIEYLLRVSGSDGDFELNAWNPAELAARPVLAVPAVRAKTARGSLSVTDSFDPLFQPGGEYLKDDLRLDLAAVSPGRVVELRMNSKGKPNAAIDDFIALIDAENGRVVAANDNFLGKTNDSGLRFIPVPGKSYLLRASSSMENDIGTYVVSAAMPKLSPKTPLATLAIGAGAAGKLAFASERDDRYGTPKRDYLLAATASDQEISVTLSSVRFDAYLIVLDATDHRVVMEADAGGPAGGVHNARAVFTAEADHRYIVRATTYTPEESGPYTLTSESNP